jgi:DNA modification methylase
MPAVVFQTPYGQALCGDSLAYLQTLPDSSIDLVLTSPPFALLRQKTYGNHDQTEYVDWLCRFGREVLRVLKPSGSYVVDLGGAYERGRPVRSLYQYRVLIRHVDDLGFSLAEEFFWHNPSKLPSPIEWVNKRKIRAKDTVNTVWWFSKSDSPKSDVTKVLPYSARMKSLLQDPEKFYTPKERPSGHQIGKSFAKDNGGAIPSNLLQLPNTESNSTYLRGCKYCTITPHPARFPIGIPNFFIQFLTEPGDVVLDIFAGSGTTGESAEHLGRQWTTIDIQHEYVIGSALRFLSDRDDAELAATIRDLSQGKTRLISPMQPQLF